MGSSCNDFHLSCTNGIKPRNSCAWYDFGCFMLKWIIWYVIRDTIWWAPLPNPNHRMEITKRARKWIQNSVRQMKIYWDCALSKQCMAFLLCMYGLIFNILVDCILTPQPHAIVLENVSKHTHCRELLDPNYMQSHAISHPIFLPQFEQIILFI